MANETIIELLKKCIMETDSGTQDKQRLFWHDWQILQNQMAIMRALKELLEK